MKLKKYRYKIVNSTNDLAIKIIKNTNNKSGIVIANKQKKGRGQYGKKWSSFKGNLFVSIFFPIDKIRISIKDLTKANCLLVKKLLSTVIAAFYYLKIIKVIYFDEEKEKYDTDHNVWLKISLSFSTLLILLYFIYPSKLVEIVSRINVI